MFVNLKNIRIARSTGRAYLLVWNYGSAVNEAWTPEFTIRKDENGKLRMLRSWAIEKLPKIFWRDSVTVKAPSLLECLTVHSPLKINFDGNMPQQTDAIMHLHNKTRFALFMECRAGKTKVSIDLMTNFYFNGHITRLLWICPVSVLATAKWQWSVFRQDITQDKQGQPLNVMFFGSETLSGCKTKTFKVVKEFVAESGGKCGLIVDESHMFKNDRAKRSKRLEFLLEHCNIRGILSGSPITQNVSDIYNQAQIMDKRILGYRSFWHFSDNHLIMSDRFPGLVRDTFDVDKITKKLARYTFDYFPDDDGKDIQRTIYTEMSDHQKELYYKVKTAVLERLEQTDEPGTEIYLLFTALQSVLSGHISARVLSSVFGGKWVDAIIETPKIKALVRERASLDGMALIWCARRHELNTIQAALPDVITVSGQDTPKTRHEKIQMFRQSERGTLAAMLPVAKRGIDIYECDNAYFYGHSFDYESRIQASARIKAPAVKSRVCTYVDFLYEDSLDERIQAAHDRKSNIVSEYTELMKRDREKCLEELKNI